MSFRDGAAGVLAGFVIVFVAAQFYAHTQYIYPMQAAFWLTVGFLGLLVCLLSPVWFWVGPPLRRRLGNT